MTARLTQTSISALKPQNKPYWITDESCQNLRLYVGASSKVWYVGYRDQGGKYQNHKLGSADALTVAQARDMAKGFAGRVIRGESVKKEKPPEKLTLGKFFDNAYFPHLRLNHKSAKGDKIIGRIREASA